MMIRMNQRDTPKMKKYRQDVAQILLLGTAFFLVGASEFPRFSIEGLDFEARKTEDVFEEPKSIEKMTGINQNRNQKST